MRTLEAIRSCLDAWPQPRIEGTRVVIASRCLYPSKSVVHAYIEGGETTAVVSDGGGAIDDVERFLDCDLDQAKIVRRTLGKVVRSWGLSVSTDGWIHTQQTPYAHVASAIAVVTSASVDAAKALLKHARPQRERDYRIELDAWLSERYHGRIQKKVKLIGDSNKQHVFDYLVTFPSGRTVVLDAVTPDPSSVNSAIVSHFDLRNLHKERGDEKCIQRIVYNDEDEWNSSDLALLETGATPIAFTKVRDALDRLAA